MSEKRLKLSDYTETNERGTVMKIKIVDFLDDLIRERLEKVIDCMSEQRFTIQKASGMYLHLPIFYDDVEMADW